MWPTFLRRVLPVTVRRNSTRLATSIQSLAKLPESNFNQRSISTHPKVVQTHSSYCAGLLPFAHILANRVEIKRIVPGRMTRSRGQTEHFELAIQVATDVGWKCAARKGSQIQEVFIVTDASEEELAGLIEETHSEVAPKRTSRTRKAQRARGHTLLSNS
jgi:hypothetical protein